MARPITPRAGFMAAAIVAGSLQAGLLGAASSQSNNVAVETWSGDRAMADIAQQLRFAPRAIGTPGHEETIDYIKAELAKTAAKTVKTQSWQYSAPDGRRFNLTNIIASFNPENPRRIIAATHYDSLVRAYLDAEKPNDPMPGANNSASGVAVLLETARALTRLPAPPFGIDFIFFDGEEGPLALGAGDQNWAALPLFRRAPGRVLSRPQAGKGRGLRHGLLQEP
jgi:peptidase M28-like protein